MMDNVRLVKASLNAVFEEGSPEVEEFHKEFNSLHMLHDDPLSVWLKSEKIRKESEDTDKVLLTLLAELHRKIDELSLKLTMPGPMHIPLEHSGLIEFVGHGYFMFDKEHLHVGKRYYARIHMPTFPRRYLPLFFEAHSEKMGKIVLMHEDDKRDWSSYMAACERAMIRQMKGKEGEY
jgi:hypothetical protein